MRVRSRCCGGAFEGGEGAPSAVHSVKEGATTDGGSGDGVYLPAVFRDGERSRGLHIEATHVTYAARLALLVVPLGDTRAETWALGVLEDGEVNEAPLGIEADHHADEAAEALLRVALDGEADECATLLRGVDGEAVGLTFARISASAIGAVVTLLTTARIPETRTQMPPSERSMLGSVELSFFIALAPAKVLRTDIHIDQRSEAIHDEDGE